MNKTSRLLWIFVLAQTCALVAAVGWRIDHEPRSHDARLMHAVADIRGGLETALDMFSNDCGRFPTTAEGLGALIKCPISIPESRWRGPYLDTPGIAPDPWGHDYVYDSPGIHNTSNYDLYSLGPHGISESGGDPANIIGNWTVGSIPVQTGTVSASADRFFDIESFIMLLMLFIPLSFVACGSVARFSRKAREFFIRNHEARSLWLISSLIAILLFLGFLMPRVVG